jgi:hypothetical protein
VTDWLWFRREDLFGVSTERLRGVPVQLGVGVQPHPIAMTLDSRIAAVVQQRRLGLETIADRGPIVAGTFAPGPLVDFVGRWLFRTPGGFDDWATRMAVRLRF